MTERAWLHRKRKLPWMFEPDKLHGMLVHKTRANTYAIIEGHKCGKPFWVGLLTPDKKAWITVEKHLGAHYIEFEGGGKYIFPQ
ncbi:MAG: hypothetical protein KJ604_20495 [Gammaproteobacteria bacterium]|nr:hypothetical protein [Gammaproteobacteria bacterium]